MENWFAFSLAAMALLCVPGPTNTLIATNAALIGFRSTLMLLPAELAGYLTGILGWSCGLAIAARIIPSATTYAAVAACCALFVSATKLWRWSEERDSSAGSCRREIFIVTLVNPKALLFTLSIIPYLRNGQILPALPYLCWLSILIPSIGAIWTMIGAGLALRFRQMASSRAFARIGALVLVFFAASLFISTIVKAFNY